MLAQPWIALKTRGTSFFFFLEQDMRSRSTLLVATTFLIAPALTARDSWIVRENGAGPAKIGMNLSELNRALNEKFVKSEAKDEQECYYLKPVGHDVGFMMLNDRLA